MNIFMCTSSRHIERLRRGDEWNAGNSRYDKEKLPEGTDIREEEHWWETGKKWYNHGKSWKVQTVSRTCWDRSYNDRRRKSYWFPYFEELSSHIFVQARGSFQRWHFPNIYGTCARDSRQIVLNCTGFEHTPNIFEIQAQDERRYPNDKNDDL